MALLWAAATTVALGPPGCFRPDFPVGAACAPGDQCPDGLECTAEGICCPPGEPACSPDGGTPADAGPDADPREFTDFLEPFECDGDTLMLVHFDEASAGMANFGDECDSGLPVDEYEAGFADTGRFGGALKLNTGVDEFSKYLKVSSGLEPVQAYTIEAWIGPASFPTDPERAVIASAFDADAAGILDALFALSVTADQRVRLDLFHGANCRTFVDAGGLVSSEPLPGGGMSHIRAVVTATEARLYIDGLRQAETELSSPPCFDFNASELRVGGVNREDNTDLFETGDFRRFEGVVDEVRLSRVAR